jgi:xylose isomerase
MRGHKNYLVKEEMIGMKIKQAIITGFMGRLRDRFTEYHAPKTIEEKIQMISKVKGADGVELIYPHDCENLKTLKRCLSRYQLGVAAVNVNIKAEPEFVNGAVSSYSKKVRGKAVDFLKRGMDVASELGVNRITCAPLNDGYDYLFQVEYRRVWDYTVSSFREAAQHNPDVIVSIEYKPSEPRVQCLVDSASKTLCLCQAIGESNLGITIDVGHSLAVGETPAEALCLIAASPWSYYAHINDNNRKWDWDLIPGTRNFWDYLEFIFYLKELNYDGWMTSDMAPVRLDAIEAFSRTIETTKRIIQLAKRLDSKRLFRLMEKEKTIEVLKLLEKEVGMR